MNKYLCFLLSVFLFISESDAKIYSGFDMIKVFKDSDNTIESGATVYAAEETIKINQNTFLINQGNIVGNIDLNGNDLGITNSGVLDGILINSGENRATVLQTISSDAEFTSLQLGSNVDLYAEIKNINNLSLDKLKSLNAQHYDITNSEIYIDDLTEWNTWEAKVSFLGVNNLHLPHVDTEDSEESVEVKDVENIQNVNIELPEGDVDDLHRIEITNTDTGVEVDVVRETDYSKIFDNDNTGNFLEDLRNNKNDTDFINKMDSANDRQELENVMNSSYHFNHKFLLRPVYTAHNMGFTDFINDININNLNLSAKYIGGNKTKGISSNAHIMEAYKNLFFGIGFNFNKFNYQDDINDFDVLVYGPELITGLNINSNVWIKGKAGLSIAKYKAQNVYYNKDIVNNPHGNSQYGMLDFGYDYDLNENFKVGVFSGVCIQHLKVLDVSDNEQQIHIGSKIKYSYEMIGIKYDYSAMAAIASNGDLMASGQFGFFSIIDEAGAYIKLDTYKNQYDLNYSVSVNIRTMF